jgi:hypothetical protein
MAGGGALCGDYGMDGGDVLSHTQGPWIAGNWGVKFFDVIVGPNGEHIGYANPSDGDEKYPAADNARLMAAAPDLLESLRTLIHDYELPLGDDHPVMTAALAAIAKAEGR